jgi:hypothetical protein
MGAGGGNLRTCRRRSQVSEALEIMDGEAMPLAWSDTAEEMLSQLSPAARNLAARAHEAARSAQHLAQSAVTRAMECGRILTELQAEMGKPVGGNGSNQHRRATPPRGGIAMRFTFGDLASEIGIPARTAERWMALAKAEAIALQVEEGEVVEAPAGPDGRARTVGGTPEAAEAARAWRESLYAGETPMARAAPALWGALTTYKAGRAPTDHARNIAAAIAKLKTSLRHLDAVDAREVVELEAMFVEVVPMIPQRWLVQGGVR